MARGGGEATQAEMAQARAEDNFMATVATLGPVNFDGRQKQ